MSHDEGVFEYEPRLARVREHVRENLSRALTMDEVAAVAGLDTKYFSVFFRRHVGLNFREWLARLRVKRAAELFGSANHPVTRVASLTGFQSVRTFERAFKRHASMTPRAYKQQVRPAPLHDNELRDLDSLIREEE